MSEENPTADTTKKTVTDEDVLKNASDTYIQGLRLAIQARVTKDDGTLGEPGALPYDQLVKYYRGEPLDAKE